MPLRLSDKWVWDFWFAHKDGDEHHVFYLQAPRALGNTKLRHHSATIGHAVSHDLSEWTVLPDALLPGPAGSWDDLATWTGSVIEHEGLWHMLYTGINRSEQGLIQRIGLATSEDLIEWEKHPGNPVLQADPRWYELLDLERWRDQSWRDPWLYREADGTFNVLITARSPDGDPSGAGVLAHAVSDDLVAWSVQPPITAPGDFAQVECPQLVTVDGTSLILFSCLAQDHSPRRRKRLGIDGTTGTFTFFASEEGEPLSASAVPIIAPDSEWGPLYAGKLVELGHGRRGFVGFRGAGDEDFIGELIDPVPVSLASDGCLRPLREEEEVVA
jgi:beta-fructofuranosidase